MASEPHRTTSGGRRRKRQPEGSFRVECFMLCEAVQSVEDKLYILGGGIRNLRFSRIEAEQEPWELKLAIRIVGTPGANQSSVPLRLEALAPDGSEILPALDLDLGLDAPGSGRAKASAAAFIIEANLSNLPAAITTSGIYQFRLFVHDEKLAETELVITEQGSSASSEDTTE